MKKAWRDAPSHLLSRGGREHASRVAAFPPRTTLTSSDHGKQVFFVFSRRNFIASSRFVLLPRVHRRASMGCCSSTTTTDPRLCGPPPPPERQPPDATSVAGRTPAPAPPTSPLAATPRVASATRVAEDNNPLAPPVADDATPSTPRLRPPSGTPRGRSSVSTASRRTSLASEPRSAGSWSLTRAGDVPAPSLFSLPPVPLPGGTGALSTPLERATPSWTTPSDSHERLNIHGGALYDSARGFPTLSSHISARCDRTGDASSLLTSPASEASSGGAATPDAPKPDLGGGSSGGLSVVSLQGDRS